VRIDTFIFVHDQQIILDYDRIGNFSCIEEFKYVFLGTRPVDLISDRNDIIFARDFDENIEYMSGFCAFTGWYLIWKNGLSNADYINLFEYDVILEDSFIDIQKNELLGKNVLGYVPINVHDYWYINDDACAGSLLRAVNDLYGIKYIDFVHSMSSDEVVSITSNHTFSREFFDSFMKWFMPLVPSLESDTMCGHFPERAVSIYYKTQNLDGIIINESILKHYRLDSHETSGFDRNEMNINYNEMLSMIKTSTKKMKIGIVIRGFHMMKYTDYRHSKQNFLEKILSPISHHEVSIYLCTYYTEHFKDLVDFYKPKRFEIVEMDGSNQISTFIKALKLVDNEDLDFLYVIRFDSWFYLDISKLIDYEKINFTQRLDPPIFNWDKYKFVSDISFFFPKSYLGKFIASAQDILDNPSRPQLDLHGIYEKITKYVSDCEVSFMTPTIWQKHSDSHPINDILRFNNGEIYYASVCGY